jgi:hypothetical protein
MTKTAQDLGPVNVKTARGQQRLYYLDPPVTFIDYNYDTNEESDNYTNYVVVSAATVPFSGPETYIFPSNKEGEIKDFNELYGSYRGGLSHERALKNAGYTIIKKERLS